MFYSVVVTIALLLLLARLPERSAFEAADARREADRLAELVRRTRLWTPVEGRPLHVTWSPAPGGYRGLALLPQWHRAAADAGPEAHLAVRLTFERALLLRNPARSPLPAAILAREPAASDLVDAGSRSRLALAVEGTVAGGPLSVVAVDNVRRPAGKAAADAVGRGWDALMPPGSADPPGVRDVRMLGVLTKLLRGRICRDLAVWSSCHDTSLTLARSPRPGVYRITLSALSETVPGEVPFELRVTPAIWGGARGTLRPLGGADLGLPAQLLVLPPRNRLEVAGPDDPGLVAASYRPGDPRWTERRWTVDLRALLAGTEW